MQSLETSYYAWCPPGVDVKVRFRRSVMAALERQAGSGRKESPGVLLGSRTGGVLKIESKAEIDTAGRLSRIEAPGHVIAGFYRWDLSKERTGPLVGLTGADRELLDRWTPRQPAVFLLLRPEADGRVLGNLVYSGNGVIRRNPDFSPFPFAGGETKPSTPPKPRLEWRPRRDSETSSEPAASVPRKRSVVGWIVLAAALAASAVLARYTRAASPIVPAERVEIIARTAPDQVRIEWEPGTAAIKGAASGLIVVTDGPMQTRFELDRAGLDTGFLSYAPRGRLITFSLETHLPTGRTGRGILIYLDSSR